SARCEPPADGRSWRTRTRSGCGCAASSSSRPLPRAPHDGSRHTAGRAQRATHSPRHAGRARRTRGTSAGPSHPRRVCARVGKADRRVEAAMNAAELRNRVTMTKAETKRALGRLTGDPKAKTEAQVQREIVNALKLAGWSVWRIGQRDARKTQDPGVPDLYAMRSAAWRATQTAYLSVHGAGHVFIEVKRPVGGVQSPEQREFQSLAKMCGQPYILARSVDDIKELLT